MSFDAADNYPNDPEMRAVSLGIEVEHFLEHDKVGIYLRQKAYESREAALEALAVADPLDTKTVIKLQMDARIPALFMEWLVDAIAKGKCAEESIKEQELDGRG